MDVEIVFLQAVQVFVILPSFAVVAFVTVVFKVLCLHAAGVKDVTLLYHIL